MDTTNRSRSTTRLAGGYDRGSPRDEERFLDRFDRRDYGRGDTGTLAHRSRSLDLRREQAAEDDFEASRQRFGSNAAFAYDRGYRRGGDYEESGRRRTEEQRGGDYWGDHRQLGERYSPRGRERSLGRSQEWYPRRGDERQHSPRHRNEPSTPRTRAIDIGGLSPRSAASGRKDQQLRVNVMNGKEAGGFQQQRTSKGFYCRKEEPSPRSAIYSKEEGYRGGGETRRMEGGGEWTTSGGGGSRYHHQSSSYQQHGGTSGGGGFFKRSPMLGGGRQGFDATPPRPHRRIHCCCLTFVWPPWSYEIVEAPQPIYRPSAGNPPNPPHF